MKAFYDIGRYEVEIIEQGFVKASTGNTQFVLKFKVLGKIDPADDSALIAVDEQTRSYYRVLTENTIPYFMEDLAAIQVEINSFADIDPNTDGFIDLAGRKIDMRCGRKNNLQNESVEEWSLARAASKPMDKIASTEVKALDRLFGKHLKKSAAPARTAQQRGPVPVAAAKAQPAQGGGVAISDDDVPF